MWQCRAICFFTKLGKTCSCQTPAVPNRAQKHAKMEVSSSWAPSFGTGTQFASLERKILTRTFTGLGVEQSPEQPRSLRRSWSSQDRGQKHADHKKPRTQDLNRPEDSCFRGRNFLLLNYLIPIVAPLKDSPRKRVSVVRDAPMTPWVIRGPDSLL